ncbi:protein CLT2, chloroplastic isoform X2 [Cicer arietinum]|uniref:Protein CLT2, chloroplastic isoform X2 n=1 Tax=Cicer arietinum TaxID=3827 RepID=A0A1S2YBH7_CICAR|nr:protein CLT2, chloroplastic isoform X2 [Cicer arietinum]
MAAVYSSFILLHTFPSRSSFSRFHFHNLKLNNNNNPIFPMSSSLPLKSPFHLLPSHVNKFNRTNRTVFKFRASSSSSGSTTLTNRTVLFTSVITVTLAVANRVLYKLALIPMSNYPFFLAQFTTFGYVVIYFSILYIRYQLGIVTNEMLAIPKWRFFIIGFLEALGLVTGMFAGAILPGPVIPILNQTFLVWQLMFSALILRRRYSINQVVGCLLVGAGVVVAISSGSNAGQMLSEVEFFWPALMIVSCAFQAGASIIKEFVFLDSSTQLKKSLDIFVVNSFGSGFQALFVLLFLPLLSNLKGIPFVQLPSYLKSGAGCFLNIGAGKAGCDGAPLLPLLYVVTNLVFNISLLNVLKSSSAVVASLMLMLSVPISVYILSLPLPYLPEGGTTLSPFFLLGCAILVCGLYLYNTTRPARKNSEDD